MALVNPGRIHSLDFWVPFDQAKGTRKNVLVGIDADATDNGICFPMLRKLSERGLS
jgi:hypothetical protein